MYKLCTNFKIADLKTILITLIKVLINSDYLHNCNTHSLMQCPGYHKCIAHNTHTYPYYAAKNAQKHYLNVGHLSQHIIIELIIHKLAMCNYNLHVQFS